MIMKSRWIKIIIPYFILLIVLSIILYYFFILNTIEQNKDLINVIYQQIYNNSEINFQSVIDFKWDSLLVIAPYSSPRQVFKDNGLRWQRISTNITSSDHITLLIFLKNNKIVSYVDYPRSKGDFTCLIQSLELNIAIFNKKDAKFTISKDENRLCIENFH